MKQAGTLKVGESHFTLHTTARVSRCLGGNQVYYRMKEALGASYSNKWEPENLVLHLEIDSVLISGECAMILHESMRMAVQTFCM